MKLCLLTRSHLQVYHNSAEDCRLRWQRWLLQQQGYAWLTRSNFYPRWRYVYRLAPHDLMINMCIWKQFFTSYFNLNIQKIEVICIMKTTGWILYVIPWNLSFTLPCVKKVAQLANSIYCKDSWCLQYYTIREIQGYQSSDEIKLIKVDFLNLNAVKCTNVLLWRMPYCFWWVSTFLCHSCIDHWSMLRAWKCELCWCAQKLNFIIWIVGVQVYTNVWVSTFVGACNSNFTKSRVPCWECWQWNTACKLFHAERLSCANNE